MLMPKLPEDCGRITSGMFVQVVSQGRSASNIETMCNLAMKDELALPVMSDLANALNEIISHYVSIVDYKLAREWACYRAFVLKTMYRVKIVSDEEKMARRLDNTFRQPYVEEF